MRTVPAARAEAGRRPRRALAPAVAVVVAATTVTAIVVAAFGAYHTPALRLALAALLSLCSGWGGA